MTVSSEALGLSSAQVAERVARGEVNTLPPRSGRSTADIVRANVFTRINAILFVLFVIVISTGSIINAAFGMLIIANSAIGIIQELRAKRTLDSLAVVGESRPQVRRNGGLTTLDRDEIVIDDVIEIGPGDQVIVDGVMVEADYLEIDESLLTGEADPEPKDVGSSVMSGSFVVAGSGAYRATKVGLDSYAAQLTAQASKFSLVHSELQSGINKILRFITWLLIPIGVATILVQLSLASISWRDSLLSMAGLLVPMVPEGLVLLTSMAFALGVIRLGKRKCLVNELPAIEGLARVDVVCADKTGTLTENRMTLGQLRVLDASADAEVREVLRQLVAADPHPNASLAAIGRGVGEADQAWKVMARAPFTSAKKWSGASFATQGHWVLGAPDVLASGAIATEAEHIGASGRRVLLLGHAPAPVDTLPARPTDITPAALLVLDQSVRPDARPTLEYFRRQGVEIKVISGDNAASVGAVTDSLGMHLGPPVDARSLPRDKQALADTLATSSVFGRVTPDQKCAMVGALQSRGHHVAMTGDGVNDVLALKDADLGVAMGSGSAATRAVAKIVLLDDRFATLPHVVGEGRRVIGNIERVAKLFLTKTVYSALVALLSIVWRIPGPFMPIHVTITGWFTIGIPAFLLSLAPNNDRAQPGFVRRVMMIGLPAGLIVGLASFTTYLLTLAPDASGRDPHASTAALATLILSSTWMLSTVARPYQWWRVGLVAAAFAAYTAIFLIPWTQRLFVLDTSDRAAMTIGIVVGLIGMACIEALWWVWHRVRGETPVLWRADPLAVVDDLAPELTSVEGAQHR